MTKIKKTKRGFEISRTACIVCGEPPFGDEYCCGHSQRKYSGLMKHRSASDGWEWADMNVWGNGDVSFVTVDGRKITYLSEHPKTGEGGIVNALSNSVYGMASC